MDNEQQTMATTKPTLVSDFQHSGEGNALTQEEKLVGKSLKKKRPAYGRGTA